MTKAELATLESATGASRSTIKRLCKRAGVQIEVTWWGCYATSSWVVVTEAFVEALTEWCRKGSVRHSREDARRAVHSPRRLAR